MGNVLIEHLDNWKDGVNTTLRENTAPITALIKGYNCFLDHKGDGQATPAKRLGMATMNRTAITGSPAVIGQYEWGYTSGSTLTRYHLLVSNGGRLDRMATDGTLTTISATAFTSGDYQPAFASAKNACFIVNGQDRKKVVISGGSPTLQNFGITRPTVGTMAGAAGAAGLHNGTYELRVTYGNSITGHESSASDTASATVTVTNQQISWSNIPVSSDSQVDRRYLSIRNTATMSNFYRAGTITNNVDTTATTSALDANLVTVTPDTSENDPPVSGITALAWHKSRLFAALGSNLYYSKVDEPEAFDPDNYEPVAADNGQRIVALIPASDFLFVLKANSVYYLAGDDPQSWSVTLVIPDLGCAATASVKYVNGNLYWWSEAGPIVWDLTSSPRRIGQNLIAATISPDNLNYAYISSITAGIDLVNQRIVWSVPETSQSRNTMLLPFSYHTNVWEASKWDPMDIASMAEVHDASGVPWLMFGNYGGQVFKWWTGHNDGIAGGTYTGTFTASATSMSVITDATATFDTTGAGLKERRVTVYDSDHRQMGSIRPRISSNTGTALTLATAASGLSIGSAYTYVVGGPFFEIDTRWCSLEQPFIKKRLEFLYLQCETSATNINMDINVSTDFDDSWDLARTFTFSTQAAGGLWDDATWDDFVWSSSATAMNKRLRLAKTGLHWRARIRNYDANEPLTLISLGVRAEMLGDKLGT